jgi:hypothetical protein
MQLGIKVYNGLRLRLRLRPLVSNRRNISTQQYLDKLAITNSLPSLSDLEKFRPSRIPDSNSPLYKNVYETTLDQLSKSFTKPQLIAFGHLLGHDLSKLRNKKAVLENIMDFGLKIPSPTSIESARRARTDILAESMYLHLSTLMLTLCVQTWSFTITI